MTEEHIDEAVDGFRDSDAFTERERIALEYSHLMQHSPKEIDGEFYARLAEHFSTAEIVELGVFIGFNVGYHTFFSTLDFYPMFSPDGRLIDQEESRRIYGPKPRSLLEGAIARASESSVEAEPT